MRELADPGLGPLQRRGAHDDLARPSHARLVETAITEPLPQGSRGRPYRGLHGGGGEEHALALAQVVPGPLARLVRIPEDAEHVVA